MSPKYRTWLMAIGFALIGLSLLGSPALQTVYVVEGEVYEGTLPDEVYESVQNSEIQVETYLASFGMELPGPPMLWIAAVMLISGVAGYRIGLRLERFRAARRMKQ